MIYAKAGRIYPTLHLAQLFLGAYFQGLQDCQGPGRGGGGGARGRRQGGIRGFSHGLLEHCPAGIPFQMHDTDVMAIWK